MLTLYSRRGPISVFLGRADRQWFVCLACCELILCLRNDIKSPITTANCKRIHKKRTKLVMQSYWNVIHKLNGIRAKTDRWHRKAIFWWYDENEIFNLRQIEMSSISAWRGKKERNEAKSNSLALFELIFHLSMLKGNNKSDTKRNIFRVQLEAWSEFAVHRKISLYKLTKIRCFSPRVHMLRRDRRVHFVPAFAAIFCINRLEIRRMGVETTREIFLSPYILQKEKTEKCICARAWANTLSSLSLLGLCVSHFNAVKITCHMTHVCSTEHNCISLLLCSLLLLGYSLLLDCFAALFRV